MKHNYLLILIPIIGLISSIHTLWGQPLDKQDSLAFCNAHWDTVVLNKGAEIRTASIGIFNSTQYVSIIEYTIQKHKTKILQLKNGSTLKTSEMGLRSNSEFAINGGYFNVKQLVPSTYLRIGKKVYGSVETDEFYRVNAIFGFMDRKGRQPKIEMCKPEQYAEKTKGMKSVLAAGPMLIDDGEIIQYESKNTFYTGRHPRSIIGYTDDGKMMLIVIDGRFDESEGVTIQEAAYIARLAGLYDAINLDGGGSSTLWTKTKGVLNHPYDNKIFDHEGERKVPNFIIVK